MNPVKTDQELLREMNQCITRALELGMPPEGLTLPPLPPRVNNPDIEMIYQHLTLLFSMVNEAFAYADELSRGNLTARASKNNIFAMPLKGLQSSLSHLTWQTQQVANGDFSQTVRFLGDFSQAFNQMIHALREKQALETDLKRITDILDEGLLMVNPQGKITFANPEALKLLGYDKEELFRQTIHQTIHCQTPDGTPFPPREHPLWEAIKNQTDYRDDFALFTRKSGAPLPVMISCRTTAPKGEDKGAVIAFRDITEQRQHLQSLESLNRLLKKKAATDALTGICNRMSFDKILSQKLQCAEQHNRPFSLVLFDIDHFKNINDTQGHAAGDILLMEMTRLVSQNIRKVDIFARWGGEEFVILPPGAGPEETLALAEKLRKAIQDHTPVTASFGITTYQPGDTEIRLFNRADAAMYTAKKQGRNQVQYKV